MAFDNSEKDVWCEYSSAIWLQILFLVDTVSALFCLTDSYKHHLGLIVLQAVHLGISLFLFALSFGKLKSTAITMTNVLIIAFLINSGSLTIVTWEFLENHSEWAKNEHKEYMYSVYLFCRYALCLLDVVTAFGCLAMYLKNTVFHLVQGFHIMIAFGLFGFSFDHTKKGIWQCICFLIVDIITNTAAMVFVTLLYHTNREKWSQEEGVQAIFLIIRYSFFYLIYLVMACLFYRVLKKVKKEHEIKQELSVFDPETMGKVKVDLRSNRNSLY